MTAIVLQRVPPPNPSGIMPNSVVNVAKELLTSREARGNAKPIINNNQKQKNQSFTLWFFTSLKSDQSATDYSAPSKNSLKPDGSCRPITIVSRTPYPDLLSLMPSTVVFSKVAVTR